MLNSIIKKIYLKILHKLKSLLQYFNRKSNSSIVIPPEIIDDSFRKSNYGSAITNAFPWNPIKNGI